MFGGFGLDSAGGNGSLNDLWKFTAGEWTWVNGPKVINQKGAYGSLGSAAGGNIPGARYNSASWVDASGTLWLFGGSGYDSAGTLGGLNDLWKFTAGQWTWVGGSNTVRPSGVYGTQGSASTLNVPGARFDAQYSTDPAGNFWLFGGDGYDSAGKNGSAQRLCGSTPTESGRG